MLCKNYYNKLAYTLCLSFAVLPMNACCMEWSGVHLHPASDDVPRTVYDSLVVALGRLFRSFDFFDACESLL